MLEYLTNGMLGQYEPLPVFAQELWCRGSKWKVHSHIRFLADVGWIYEDDLGTLLAMGYVNYDEAFRSDDPYESIASQQYCIARWK
jgi:hypothetical protein